MSVFGGAALLGNVQNRVADFFAGDPAGRGGVRVAVADLDGDELADLVTGAGGPTAAGRQVVEYAGTALHSAPTQPTELRAFDPLPGFAGGVFVG